MGRRSGYSSDDVLCFLPEHGISASEGIIALGGHMAKRTKTKKAAKSPKTKGRKPAAPEKKVKAKPQAAPLPKKTKRRRRKARKAAVQANQTRIAKRVGRPKKPDAETQLTSLALELGFARSQELLSKIRSEAATIH